MAPITLRFVAPDAPDLVALKIWEGDTATDPFGVIETLTEIGTPPNYIDYYTSLNASDPLNHWFAISWVNSKGDESDISDPLKGGSKSLVGEIVERVMLRDTLDALVEEVVLQEAEAVLSFIYKKDPYTIDVTTISFAHLGALVDLTLASALFVEVIKTSSSSTSDYTAGLVSEKQGGGNATNILKAIDQLEKRALKRLGIGGTSIVGQIVDSSALSITGTKTIFDASRLLAVSAIITEEMVEVDVG